MFVEHTFDVKHLALRAGLAAVVTPLRDHGGMEAAGSPALHVGPTGVAAASPAGRSVRLPEGVYRRRRLVVVAVAVAVLALVLVAARPDRVPPGEANPWSSMDGVYVVRPGDTLWDIAVALSPGADPRAVVHELAEAAGGAMLEPGQQLVVDAVTGIAYAGVAGNGG